MFVPTTHIIEIGIITSNRDPKTSFIKILDFESLFLSIMSSPKIQFLTAKQNHKINNAKIQHLILFFFFQYLFYIDIIMLMV